MPRGDKGELTHKQEATPVHGAVGTTWRGKAGRSGRVMEITERCVSDRTRIVRWFDPSRPGYVTVTEPVACWVTASADGRRVSCIRDDVLGRLFVKVEGTGVLIKDGPAHAPGQE